MKNNYIHDIPNHKGLGIDNEGTIYFLDDNREVIKQISSNITKFTFQGKTLCPGILFNISFFGVEQILHYREFNRIDDDSIFINDRIFKRISILPEFINKYYYISDDGVIYSLLSHKLRKHQIDEDGYHRISFSYSNLTNMAIHRLVYSVWKETIPEGLVIDHINNLKWDNRVSNLQAITAKQNSRMAVIDGLFAGRLKLNEDKVHLACKLMEQNTPMWDIAKALEIDINDKKMYKLFTNRMAAMRKPDYPAWKDIVSQYNISQYKGYANIKSKYSDLEILDMRRMYNEGITITEIANKYGPDNRAYIRRLAKGKKRKLIAV